jgi:cobalt/nickel transport system ATP-binding protein
MRKKVIELNNLEYTYPDGTQALRGISLDIFEQESVALIGPNGAGKSTLLLHLNGILKGDKGWVRILGKEIHKKNLNNIRNKVGIVFQDPDDQLFSTSVFDDVAFGPINMGLEESIVRERVKKALADVDMEGYAQRCPHHLSIGEKKRISIATVLSMGPEILVLDEPTSNLDPRSRRSMINLFNGWFHTKIIATHDMEMVAETCTRTILLSKGIIVADGTTREILTNIELLEAHGLEPPSMVKFFKAIGSKEIPLTLGEAIVTWSL